MKEHNNNNLSYQDACTIQTRSALMEVDVIFEEGKKGEYKDYFVPIDGETAALFREYIRKGFFEHAVNIAPESPAFPLHERLLHEESNYRMLDIKLQNVELHTNTSEQQLIAINKSEIDTVGHVMANEHNNAWRESKVSNEIDIAHYLEEAMKYLNFIGGYERQAGKYTSEYKDYFMDTLDFQDNMWAA